MYVYVILCNASAGSLLDMSVLKHIKLRQAFLLKKETMTYSTGSSAYATE